MSDLAPDNGHIITLDRAKRGATLQVAEVTGGDAIARRLIDLGFHPGTEVLVERVAPLGDPVQYRLHGYRLALRRSEARRVRVAAAAAGGDTTTQAAR